MVTWEAIAEGGLSHCHLALHDLHVLVVLVLSLQALPRKLSLREVYKHVHGPLDVVSSTLL